MTMMRLDDNGDDDEIPDRWMAKRRNDRTADRERRDTARDETLMNSRDSRIGPGRIQDEDDTQGPQQGRKAIKKKTELFKILIIQ